MKRPTKLVIVYPDGTRRVVNRPMIVHHFDGVQTVVIEIERENSND